MPLDVTTKLPAYYKSYSSYTFECKNHGWFDIRPVEHGSQVIGMGNVKVAQDMRGKNPTICFNGDIPICPVEQCTNHLRTKDLTVLRT